MPNHEAERHLIGSALVNPSTTATLQANLDYLSSRHRKIAEAIIEVYEDTGDTDAFLVVDILQRAGTLKELGGHAYICACLDGLPKSANAAHYAKLVRKSRNRDSAALRVSEVSQAIEKGATDGQVREMLEDFGPNILPLDGSGVRHETLTEILARPIPETAWALNGLLAERDIAIFSGPAYSGKTWTLLSMSLSLAGGIDFCGYGAGRAYKVAILDLEDHPESLDARLHRLAAGLELDEVAIARVKIIRERLRLDKAEDVQRIRDTLTAWGTDWLMIDSLRRAFGGTENDSETISNLFTEALDPIRSGGTGVFLTDHHRKRTGDKTMDDPAETLRGSTDKRAMCDVHVSMEPREERLAFIPTKVRHGLLPEASLIEIVGLQDAHHGPIAVRLVGSLDRASDHVQDSILALLETEPGGKPRGELIGRLGFSERAIDRALTAMKDKRKIRKERRGKAAIYLANL